MKSASIITTAAIKTIKVLLVMAFMQLPGHAQALPRIALYTSSAFDIAGTEAVIHQHHFAEANPLLGQNPVRRVGTGLAITVGVDMAARYLAAQHPKLSTLVRAIGTGVHIAAGFANIKLAVNEPSIPMGGKPGSQP